MTDNGLNLNLDLLERLVAAGGEGVGVVTLRETTGLGGEELLAALDALRVAGYGIERTHPHGSAAYRLREFPDRLYVHEVRRRLDTRWVGKDIRTLEICESTNDVARELVREGAPTGTLVLSEEQRAGRGRAGRRWHSAPGLGVYLSLVLRPEDPAPTPALLMVTTGVAVAHATMKVTGKPAQLRWPNDVLMDGKKVSGLLVEATSAGTRTVFVIGIGLNVNHRPGDFPPEVAERATSLAAVAERRLSRLSVLATMLASLEEWYDRMAAGEVEAIGAAWRPLSSLLFRDVTLVMAGGRTTGRVTDLSPTEGILLETPDGESSWIPAEHVMFIRPAEEMTEE